MEIQNQMNPETNSNYIKKSIKEKMNDNIVGIIRSINLIAEIFCRFYEDKKSLKPRED
ncbi:MAG: hypothetical protein P8Y70_17455 [Candidatus Lokiarchaeota archaeon]